MSVLVILDIPATAETRDAVLAALHEALPVTRAFDGCEGLELLVNQDDPANLVVYERWASRAHYAAYRAFRAETGMSPHRWLVHRRCERAKRLMAETGMPLADVAVACGFAHQAHFTNTFHRTVGTTPGRWRSGAA